MEPVQQTIPVLPSTEYEAISLYPPYSSLVAAGLKPIETREMRIHHRGPLVICSARHIATPGAILGIDNALTAPQRQLLRSLELALDGPRGCAVALVEVYDCRPLKVEDLPLSWFYGPNRFAWMLRNIQPIVPFKVRGFPGRFKLDRATVDAAIRRPE